jgi:hypothetical protein
VSKDPRTVSCPGGSERRSGLGAACGPRRRSLRRMGASMPGAISATRPSLTKTSATSLCAHGVPPRSSRVASAAPSPAVVAVGGFPSASFKTSPFRTQPLRPLVSANIRRRRNVGNERAFRVGLVGGEVSKKAPAQLVERAATRIARLSRAPLPNGCVRTQRFEESAPSVFIRYD